MLALQGFLTIGAFLAIVLGTRIPVAAALILTPIVSVLLFGNGTELGVMALDGVRTVAPVAAMIMFAMLYFGVMIDKGLFQPLVDGLLRFAKNDPVRVCLASAALPMIVALDGDGATTFLISITALLPLHRRLHINPLVLPGIVALAAGVMNLLPWGGPTARAMAALDASAQDIFTPVIPAMLAGVAWVFFAAWCMGWSERRRLARKGLAETSGEDVAMPAAHPRGALFWFNAALTLVLIACLFAHIAPLPLLFMAAFAIAVLVNYPKQQAQQDFIASQAGNVVMVVSMILAAGVFTGVLNGAGMITAMAQSLATAIPDGASNHLSKIVAMASMPLSLVFTPDAFYFGVLPVFAETARVAGEDPVTIGRAAILGQMTTGFPLSPLTASTFILIGMAGVSLRDHQRFIFLWAFGTTLVMTIVAVLTLAI